MSDRTDLKNKIESVLFSAGDYVNVQEIAKICEADPELVKSVLVELKQELDAKNSSLMLVHEANFWKLTIRERYAPVVKKVVRQPELPKSLLETLAVVAYKAPALQSQVIKIRTNKAYRHLDELEQKGYISREKKGRTKLIKLTQKFFDYFDVPPEKLKERFARFQQLEAEIRMKEASAKQAEKPAKPPEKTPEIALLDEKGKLKKLKTYTTVERLDEETPEEKVAPLELEKIDGLEVYEAEQPAEKKEKPKKKPKHEPKPPEEIKEETEEGVEELPEEEVAEEEGLVEELPEEGPEEGAEEVPEEEGVVSAEEPLEKKIPEKKEGFEERIKAEAERAMPKRPAKEGAGLFAKGIPPEIQERIEKRVKEIVSPPKEESEEFAEEETEGLAESGQESGEQEESEEPAGENA